MEEDEMVEWHHGLDGHESEQALGVGDGQGSLACCIPWDCKESDMTKRLNLSELYLKFQGEIGKDVFPLSFHFFLSFFFFLIQ